MAKRRQSNIPPTPVFQGVEFGQDRTEERFRLDQVEACQYYFSASDCRQKYSSNQLVLLFGSNSAFEEDSANFDQAVELILPVTAVKDSFIESVWHRNSLLKDEPFVTTVRNALSHEEIRQAESYVCERRLPKDRGSSFRRFNANYSASTIFNAQCAIEFFQIPFDYIRYRAGQKLRPGDQVRSILTVVMDSILAYSLYYNVKREWDSKYAHMFNEDKR